MEVFRERFNKEFENPSRDLLSAARFTVDYFNGDESTVGGLCRSLVHLKQAYFLSIMKQEKNEFDKLVAKICVPLRDILEKEIQDWMKKIDSMEDKLTASVLRSVLCNPVIVDDYSVFANSVFKNSNIVSFLICDILTGKNTEWAMGFNSENYCAEETIRVVTHQLSKMLKKFHYEMKV